MKCLNVVAGILLDADDRILIAERVDAGRFHGMWEFPGGKIGTDESPEVALLRELREELGIIVECCETFMRIDHHYEDQSVDLQFFKVRDWIGEPTGIEGQQLRWVAPADIELGMMLPADEPVIEALR